VYAISTLPEDLDERQKVLEETLFEGKPDIHRQPKYWSEYAAGTNLIGKAAKPISLLLEKQPDKADEINQVVAKFAGTELVYVPVMARMRALTLFLDSATWKPVAALDIDPWRDVSRDVSKEQS
jgi:hypothetical protein